MMGETAMPTYRALPILAALTLCLLGPIAADAKMPIAATVNWADATSSGTAAFDGFVEGEELRGVVKIGTEYLRVLGTVAEDGTVTGNLSIAAGQVGSFAGTLADDVLTGDVTIDGTLAAEWVAPSSEALLSELP
jgi:hypothetical protein